MKNKDLLVPKVWHTAQDLSNNIQGWKKRGILLRKVFYQVVGISGGMNLII